MSDTTDRTTKPTVRQLAEAHAMRELRFAIWFERHTKQMVDGINRMPTDTNYAPIFRITVMASFVIILMVIIIGVGLFIINHALETMLMFLFAWMIYMIVQILVAKSVRALVLSATYLFNSNWVIKTRAQILDEESIYPANNN